MWGKKTALYYFCNSVVKTSSIMTIFGTHILQLISYHPFIPYCLYNHRQGTGLSFKSTVQQTSALWTHNHRAALLRDAGLQLYRPTCDFLTFQILVRKLQNLGSAIGASLLEFCARCWWVEATSKWRFVKHPSADGHWSNDWSVTI